MDDPLHFEDEHLRRLGLVLDFGPGDLDSNRAGDLSEAQIARLAGDLRWTYWPVIGVAGLLMLLLGGSGVVAGRFPWVPVLLLAFVAAGAAFAQQFERRKLPRQAVRRTVLRIGGLSLIARRFGLVDDRDMLNRITFPVEGGKKVFGPQHLYKVLSANRTYTVYYAPVRTWGGYRILSIQPESSADDIFIMPKPKRGVKRKRG